MTIINSKLHFWIFIFSIICSTSLFAFWLCGEQNIVLLEVLGSILITFLEYRRAFKKITIKNNPGDFVCGPGR